MKTVASVILAGAVAVLGAVAARGERQAEAWEGRSAAAVAEANGDVMPAAVRAALAHVRAEDSAPAWADVAFNPDRREHLSVHAAAGQVRGRRYDGRGTPIAASFAIAPAVPGPALAPRVAYDPGTRGYLVAWVRRGGTVEAVRLDVAGAAVGPIFPVPPGGGLSRLGQPGPGTSRDGHGAQNLATVVGRRGDIPAGAR